jgi:hypothetical protein
MLHLWKLPGVDECLEAGLAFGLDEDRVWSLRAE